MAEALTIFWNIYEYLFTAIFNRIYIVSGVSLGWVLVTIFIFTVLIRSLLSLPKSAPRSKIKK